MAAGRVCTGFSHPYVAKYKNTDGTNVYAEGMQLARGVDVNITPNTSGDNDFWADNVIAESASGVFTDGTFSLTVDGLLTAAERLIMGTTSGSDWTSYDDDQKTPKMGFGYIARYQSDGEISYVPTILCKVWFDHIESSAATQSGVEFDYQTQSLSGHIQRSDDAKHTWKMVGKEYDTEDEAIAALKTKLGIQ